MTPDDKVRKRRRMAGVAARNILKADLSCQWRCRVARMNLKMRLSNEGMVKRGRP